VATRGTRETITLSGLSNEALEKNLAGNPPLGRRIFSPRNVAYSHLALPAHSAQLSKRSARQQLRVVVSTAKLLLW
jgi:chorismate-pyruvate lyase